MDIKLFVGNRIKKIRLESGISQERLALKADVDRTYLASVENGKRNISIVNLNKIVEALNVSLEKFFEKK